MKSNNQNYFDMIDKQQFNDLFQYFENEMIIELIDLACEQIPENIQAIAQNINNHNFAQLRLNACKLRGVCTLFDPVSSRQLREIEDAAQSKIVGIILISLSKFPEILSNLKEEYNFVSQAFISEVTWQTTLKDFLASLIGSFSDEDALKLEELEKRTMADGIPQMFSELKISSASLIEELLVMKQELTSG